MNDDHRDLHAIRDQLLMRIRRLERSDADSPEQIQLLIDYVAELEMIEAELARRREDDQLEAKGPLRQLS